MDWQVPTPHFRDGEEEPNQPVGLDPPGVRNVGGDEPLTSAEEERGPLPEPPVANLACRADLKKLARFQLTQTPATDDPYCVIPDPVVLQSTLGEARVTFGSGLVLDCAFALKLAGFISGPAQQLARQHRGSVLTNVITGQGFDCRRRNNAPSGKLSEHALGNGVDVVGFVFADGRRQPVVDADQLAPDEAAYQRAVRAAACGPFTTVLGPGSNAAHATHLHFDRGRSKGRQNPYLVCE